MRGLWLYVMGETVEFSTRSLNEGEEVNPQIHIIDTVIVNGDDRE